MVDLLVAWGVTQAVGFAFKPILEDLAKDAAKDWAKDLFKDSLKNVLRLPEKGSCVLSMPNYQFKYLKSQLGLT